jgi:hypothetical protein
MVVRFICGPILPFHTYSDLSFLATVRLWFWLKVLPVSHLICIAETRSSTEADRPGKNHSHSGMPSQHLLLHTRVHSFLSVSLVVRELHVHGYLNMKSSLKFLCFDSHRRTEAYAHLVLRTTTASSLLRPQCLPTCSTFSNTYC